MKNLSTSLRLILSGILLAASCHGFSQNLVSNGDFEDFSSCPTGLSQFDRVSAWLNPSDSTGISTPDFYNACQSASCSVGVPQNRLGNGNSAYSGNGYIGMITYYTVPPSPDTSTREYIAAELTEVLQSGVEYELIFYVKRSPVSFYGTEIGAHISDTLPLQDGRFAYGFTPNLVETDTIIDTTWQRVSVVFTGTGSEKYLTIGNFRNDAQTSLASPGSFYDPCGILF
ncbi:MAG: hypothetical protein AAF804_21645, partial [Bacteroidota bacterium]